MKKTTSRALASAALTALIAGMIPAHQVSAASVEFQRLSGKDRYLTAVEVSKAGWVEGSEYAVVANGDAYADALSAAPFAKQNNAPVLLTSSKGITNETINELKRLKVKKVYVIGETGVVPNSILDSIKKNVTTDVERIGGQDRYATSTKIAEKLGTVTEAMLASGEGYADALSAAPVAAVKGIPVLLTKAGELPKATSDYIKAQGIKKTFVVGGTASVSDKVKGLVPDAVRLGGKNRFETNAEIIKGFALDFNFDGAYVALANGVTGKEFADALTASAIAAKGGHPVIISNKTADAATTALINEKLSPTAKITAIGGTANLSDALVNGYKVKGEVIEAAKDVTGNAVISKDNLNISTMKVTGNLYLEGNNTTLTNVEVAGIVYVNPGKDGEAVLDNVTAKKIVVLSGASNTINFKNVKADSLNVLSNSDVRIKTEGTTAIKDTVVESKVILEATEGSFGNINVAETIQDKAIEFRGKFDKPVVVAGQATLKTAVGAEVTKVQVATENKNSKVVFDGTFKAVEVVKAATVNVTANAKIEGNFTVKAEVALDTAKGAKIENIVVTEEAKNAKVDVKGEGTINNIQNKSENAIINIGKDTEVTGKIETVNKDNIVSDNTSIGGKVEEKPADQIKVPETPVTPPSGGGGGGGGSTAHQYSLSITGGKAPYTIDLGEDDTLEDVYNEVVRSMKAGETAYEASISFANLVLEKMNTTTVGKDTNGDGKIDNVREYIAQKLLSKNPLSAVGLMLKTNPDSEAVVKYLKGKTFNEMYTLLNDKTGGTITIPELMGDTKVITGVTVNGETTSIDGEITIAHVLGLIGINPSTKLSEIASKDVTATINFKDGSKYTITLDNGVLELQLNNTYKMELK